MRVLEKVLVRVFCMSFAEEEEEEERCGELHPEGNDKRSFHKPPPLDKGKQEKQQNGKNEETNASPEDSLNDICIISDSSSEVAFMRSIRQAMAEVNELIKHQPSWLAGCGDQNNNSMENFEDHLEELTPITETVPDLRTTCTHNYERFKTLAAAVSTQQSADTQETDVKTQNVKSEGKLQIRTKRKRNLSTEKKVSVRKKKQNLKDFALIPLNYGRYGELMQRGPGGKPKYTDVATIIDQGTIVHQNINTLPASKHNCLITLDSSKIWSIEKLYYVKPILVGTVHLADLMVQDDERQLFNEEEARFVCANLLLAVQFLHRYNILHGNIMPRKIVFSDKGYPYLAYFNTAERMSQRHSRPRETIPIEYSSPEQLMSKLYANTDEFAIGVVIYEMIFGRGCHDDRLNLLDLGQEFFPSVSWLRSYDENLMFLQALESPLKMKVQQVKGRLKSALRAGTSAGSQ